MVYEGRQDCPIVCIIAQNGGKVYYSNIEQTYFLETMRIIRSCTKRKGKGKETFER